MEKLKIYWHNNKITLSIQIVGFLFFLFLAILSLLFYKERTMSFDSAGYAFELIQTKSFVIPLGRWGSIFSQVIPLLILKSGCSLVTFLKVYSFGFIFLYYIGFIIITVLFKNNRIGVVYLLTLCLAYRNTFYFTGSLFSQGLALAIVFYAMTESFCDKETKRKTIIFIFSILLMMLLYYFHQLLVLAIIFVLLATIIKNKAYTNIYLLTLFGATLLWFGIKIILLSSNSYEAEKIPGIAIFIKEMPHFFDLPSFKYFFNHFKNELIIPFIISIGACLVLLFKKRVLLLLFYIGYSIVFFILIIISFYKGEAPNMYQQYYIMFGLFLALLIDSARIKKISINYILFIVIPILIYSSQRVYAAHKLPSKRVEYISNLAKEGKKYKNKKYIIHPDDYPWGYAWVTWALPSEMLLISSINDRKNSVTCYVPEQNEIVDLASNHGQLLAAPWQKHLMNTNVLDTNYFNLPEKTNYLLTNRRPRDLFYYQEKIKYDFIWMKEIKEKAADRNISIENMILIDAEYILNNTTPTKLKPVQTKDPKKVEQKIKDIEDRIRKDIQWMETIKKKAIKKNISLDEMIRIDAEYIFNNSIKKP